jgi:hypothetical protein
MKNGQHKHLPFSQNTMLFNLWNCETHKLKKKYKTLFNKYKDVHNQCNTYTPYAIANIKCHSNLNKPQNVAYVIYYQPPSYMGTLVSTHPLHVQLLSFLDIGMHMQSRN